MTPKLYGVIEPLCRYSLMLDAGPHMQRLVGRLVLTMEREGRQGDEVSDKEQAKALKSMLERFTKPRMPDEGDVPTPETKKKWEPEPIGRLETRADWLREYSGAAKEIRETYTALSAGFFPAARDLTLGGVRSSRKFRHPVERMTDRQLEIFEDRFTPWREDVEPRAAVNSNIVARSWYELSLDVIVDGVTFRDLSWLLGTRSSTLSDVFRLSMRKYAQIAGWLK